MNGSFDDNGKTALYGIPSLPPGFYNISENGFPGVYIMGHDKFLLKDFHIVGILRRSVGPMEEFILGMLSVFLIAVLSEIVHVFLMRTSERRLSATNVIYACLVDELSHFRNIWAHLHAVRRRRGNDRRSLTSRQRAVASLVVISITLGLFVAEVVAVVLTQPILVKSTKYEYNVKGIQPIGTSRGVARFIRRVAGDRTCVSPIMTRGNQPRNFVLGACSVLETTETLSGEEDVSAKVEVGSWYHSGGSDHNVTFGEGAFFNLRIRAEIFLDANDGGSRKVFFENRDNEDLDQSKYIHERFIYSSLEWLCNKDFSKKGCEELVMELQQKSRKEKRDIVLWRGKKDDVIDLNVTGLVTTFTVGMNAPWRAMNSGIRELYASGGILEVTGRARYQNVLNDTEEDGIPGLISEEGRVAGVVLLLIVFGLLFIVLLAIRRVFKPISIAHMAMKHIGNDTQVGSEDEESMSEFSWAITPRERSDLHSRSNTDHAGPLGPGRTSESPDDESPDDVLSRMASISTWESTEE